MTAPTLDFNGDPLGLFVTGRRPAPFLTDGYLVSPVRLRARYGVARGTNLVHFLDRAASLLAKDRLTYAGIWLCRSVSKDVVLVAEPPMGKTLCAACACRAAGPAAYWFFDAEGCTLYVGSTVWFYARRRWHKRNSAWWPDVASEKVEHFASRRMAAEAENQAIRVEVPLHNVAQNPRRRRLPEVPA